MRFKKASGKILCPTNPTPSHHTMGTAEGYRKCVYCGTLSNRGVPLEARFFSHVDKNGPTPPHRPQLGPCWIWTSKETWYGYGKMFVGPKLWRVHRLSWTLHYGEIPKGHVVAHACDNRRCVRPDHLFCGTQQDNLRDMILKDRKKGVNLTVGQVVVVRSRFRAGETIEALAADYGVDIPCIRRVVNEVTWAYVQ